MSSAMPRLVSLTRRAIPHRVPIALRRTYMNISAYTVRDEMSEADVARFQNRVDQVLLSYLQESNPVQLTAEPRVPHFDPHHPQPQQPFNPDNQPQVEYIQETDVAPQ
ncbi:hypothetical protein H4R33_004383 [Dimargaris cristalligena]|nr:hypothetical protein H4R33_004383 [Dimargaris cristalligena]